MVTPGDTKYRIGRSCSGTLGILRSPVPRLRQPVCNFCETTGLYFGMTMARRDHNPKLCFVRRRVSRRVRLAGGEFARRRLFGGARALDASRRPLSKRLARE